MSKARLVAVGVAVAIVVAIVWWRRGGDSPKGETAGSAKHETTIAIAPAKGDVPTWAGQSGVGGRRIAGVVIGENGAPIAGATVRLASFATRAGLTDEPTVTTDANGRFDFDGRSSAPYDVIAEAPKLTTTVQHVDMRDPLLAPSPDQLRLVLHACDASIHGTVRDSAGGVVAGARILQEKTSATGGVTSDATGAYELCVPAGGTSVIVSADGYARFSDRVNVFGRVRRDFELSPGATVSGRVVRAGDKSPVAGALVEVRPDDRGGGMPIVTGASDADGTFVIDGVAPGRHSVVARAERLASSSPTSVIVEIGHPSDDVVCELVGTATVSGKVVIRGSSTPVAGVSVYLMGPMLGPLRSSAITQTDGTFAIDQMLPGEYRPMVQEMLRRKRDEIVPPFAKVKVDTKDVTNVVLEVDPSASISGRILSNGQPVDGASVRVEGGNESAVSAHDGTYTLRWLAEGEVSVYAESQRVGAFARSRPITLAKGENRTGVDIELNLSGSIAGIVVDQNDAPVPGAFLSFSLLHGKDFGSATTADDGTFTARALSGGGDYVYEVRQRDGSPLVYPPFEGKRFPPVTVAFGQTRIKDLRVKVRIERLAISGRVTDGANKPVSDVVVRAVPSEGRYAFGGGIVATSDQSGAFAIKDLLPGSYQLHAIAPRGEAYVEKVAAGQSNVAVRLVELGGIDGTVEGFDAQFVVALQEDARVPPARATVTGTTFTLRDLAPGVYRLIARKTSGSEFTRATVVSGQITKVTIRPLELGSVEGTVVDEQTRQPLAGRPCVSGLEDGFGGASKPVRTDARGAFRIESAPVGANIVACGGAMAKVTVVAGQTVRVELVGSASEDGSGGDVDQKLMGQGADAGLELEDQLGDVLVKSVRADGPAARAGVQRGDVLVKVGPTIMTRFGSYKAKMLIAAHPIGTPLELTLERNDKQFTATIKLEPST